MKEQATRDRLSSELRAECERCGCGACLCLLAKDDAVATETAPPTVPGIRTRFHVQFDRMEAGLPFLVQFPESSPPKDTAWFCGVECWVLDTDDRWMILRKKAGR